MSLSLTRRDSVSDSELVLEDRCLDDNKARRKGQIQPIGNGEREDLILVPAVGRVARKNTVDNA